MSDMRELYQEQMRDHDKNPRNFHALEEANRVAHGHNTSCGDQFTVYVKLADGIIEDISFQGVGCRISKSSASMMTAELKGKTLADAEALFAKFREMLAGEEELEEAEVETLGKLAVFSGVREYPARVKCASLAWHTLHAALENSDNSVSTE